MRETENLEFIAVGPWGVPSPCVRTSRVLCRKTVCGPRSTGRFLLQPHPQTPTTLPLPCAVHRRLCGVCAPQDLLCPMCSSAPLPHTREREPRACAPAVSTVSCLYKATVQNPLLVPSAQPHTPF